MVFCAVNREDSLRIALAWLVGIAVFGFGMVLADRWFWAQCNGLPTSRYGEVWICSNALALRVAIAAVSLGYRPMLAFTQPLAVVQGILYFVLPTTAAAVLASLLFRTKPS